MSRGESDYAEIVLRMFDNIRCNQEFRALWKWVRRRSVLLLSTNGCISASCEWDIHTRLKSTGLFCLSCKQKTLRAINHFRAMMGRNQTSLFHAIFSRSFLGESTQCILGNHYLQNEAGESQYWGRFSSKTCPDSRNVKLGYITCTSWRNLFWDWESRKELEFARYDNCMYPLVEDNILKVL